MCRDQDDKHCLKGALTSPDNSKSAVALRSEEACFSSCGKHEVTEIRHGGSTSSSARDDNCTHRENGHRRSRPERGNFRTLWPWEEVQRHDKVGDCWLVAHSRVYDATDFVDLHPGGRCILKCAGKDATRDYDFHTSLGKRSWEKFCIGRLQTDARGLFGALGRVW
eukprot:CAMPEP_0169113006 /NCGR_PEP_ID=MMETSP1015-20121227/27957_1 /TAXON_ID=342587 /ORGANISM="Karlodinium micrum, Strain CCMP2283" /LENGTH=165 /DNA_ID=CAMNT_0009175119 /DNA_START=58 /DNA_END=552 /DNA_ORIENTATION=+